MNEERQPTRILLDTDLGSDCDDAGALAVLHALADRGEADILGCLYSSGRNPYGPGAIAAINSYYGRSGIPIGTSPESQVGDPRNDFLEALARATDLYGHRIVRREDAPDLVAVARAALADAPDHSVCVVSIGHLCGLRDLLRSDGDGACGLCGYDLIERKVANWVAMGGAFPEEEEPGWNFGKNGGAASARQVLAEWPTPVTLCGYEIGAPLVTGKSLQSTPSHNPVREAYRLWENALENGRPSWDQAAVLCAVRGPSSFWGEQRGLCSIDQDGRSIWEDDPEGRHSYLTARRNPKMVCEEIECLMSQPPLKGRPL